jgi:hypothetical protein
MLFGLFGGATAPRLPDVVIEADSKNVPRSVAKRELARERGALPVWLRWQRGASPELDGVSVVDLTGVPRHSWLDQAERLA